MLFIFTELGFCSSFDFSAESVIFFIASIVLFPASPIGL